MIIGIDPSGNYLEGNGSTGVVCINEDEHILDHLTFHAHDYEGAMQYYDVIIQYLNKKLDEARIAEEYFRVAIEDYVLYAEKAKAQINSRMETVRLIGIIEYWAYKHDVYIVARSAYVVKKRWSNKILAHKGFITFFGRSVSFDGKQAAVLHELDALRHGLHEYHFSKEDKK